MVPNRRTKRKSKNVDSRLKISGMTEKSRHPGDFRAAFSLPLNASIRGPQYLKIWIPDKKFRE